MDTAFVLFRKSLCILILIILFFTSGSFAQTSYFYYSFFTGIHSFNRRDADGSNLLPVYNPPVSEDIYGSAVDGTRGKVYFYEQGPSSKIIYQSDYDGSNRITRHTVSARITSITAGDGYLFYAYGADPWSLRRINYDGSGDTQIYLNVAYGNVEAIAYDETNNFLYFYETDYDGLNHQRLVRTNINGGDFTVIYNNCPVIKSLSSGAGYVFYSLMNSPYTFYRMNSNGTVQTPIYTPLNNFVIACYSGVLNKLFFYDNNTGTRTIYRSDLDGSNRTPVVSSADLGGNISSMASSTLQVPEINITGNGNSIADGDVSPSATDHTDFGIANATGGTVSRTFTIQNTGTSVLTLGSNSISTSGGNSADFTVTSQPITTVAAGSSGTFTVQFDPSAAGLRSTTLMINNNDPDESPYNFSIQGTGSASITFTDGSSFTQSFTPGSSNQVIGRFRLTADATGSSLTSVSIRLNGTRTGLSNIKFWNSSDATFGGDSQSGGAIDADPGDANSVTYNFNNAIGTGLYYFLTADLAADASGIVQGVIVQNNSLTFNNAAISGTIINAVLSGNTAPLPVELTSFTSIIFNNSVLLNWQTASEVNNYGFDIERTSLSPRLVRGEAVLTEVGWAKIGFVKGNGNSNSIKRYSFNDREALNNGRYSYRLKQIDTDGSFSYSKEMEVSVNFIPAEFTVLQNYPNPFNPSTKIIFNLPVEQHVIVKIFDMLGSEVITLLNEVKPAGQHQCLWTGKNNMNQEQPSGLYLFNVKAGGHSITKKMMLIR